MQLKSSKFRRQTELCVSNKKERDDDMGNKRDRIS